MIRCPTCRAETHDSAAFCSACGAAISSLSQMPTVVPADEATGTPARAGATPPRPAGRSDTPSSGSSAPQQTVGRLSSSSFHGGFAPGAMLAERYRIVGLLGRGGMGEVYRADDLKLGQPVALKFLPRAFERDSGFLERFLAEVRTARQVSHPNVCRVYDVDDIDGRHFISMEYVDGEDLATLLRRIGRLPPSKALEIAQQLCSGLAAAHAQGVLHRDLKPSNIMIDGHGRARIADFGLAVPAADTAAREFSGTPAYMAPEQLAGQGATVRSDIYSLGLVLYELYTGHKAFEGATLAELRRAHSEHTPASLSSLAAEIDPVVERAILRCLEKDPAKRPASAVQLAASLPGGDPLAAALAAGETPSPEMVAAAGEEGALAPAKAWALLASVAVLLAVALGLNRVTTMAGLAQLEKSPEVLNARASEMIANLGYPEAPADFAGFFFQDGAHLLWRDRSMGSREHLRGLATARPSVVSYHYRRSPRPLLTVGENNVVTANDPPMTTPGMMNLVLDPGGRLQFFRAVAPQYEEAGEKRASADWTRAFREAGLDIAKFREVPSKWNPQVPYDARIAWEGPAESYARETLHVTAGSYRGRLVWFSIAGPWTPIPGQAPAQARSIFSMIPVVMNITLVLALMIGCAFFARRNVAAGRGDRKGAFRIMVFVSVVGMLDWIAGAHIAGTVNDVFNKFMDNVSSAVFVGVFLYMIYLALEPFIRRRMPDLLISWSRLLSGRFRDPLVGRDILLGIAAGALLVAILRGLTALPWWFDIKELLPLSVGRFVLGDLSDGVSLLCTIINRGFINSLAMLGMFFLYGVVLRKKWLAALGLGLTMALLFAGENNAAFLFAMGAAIGTVLTAVLLRLGQLAFLLAWFTMVLLNAFAAPMDLGKWYGSNVALAVVTLGALAVFGFYSSLGERPLFGAALED